ncbi:hypothetical protein CRYUN_Cryun33cG0042100 [Craigia yunnanensis]
MQDAQKSVGWFHDESNSGICEDRSKQASRRLLFKNFFEELKTCHQKGRIDIMEFVVERMHQDKVQPDPSTCQYVFSAYVDRGFNNTAMEVLQVLSMWMISDEDSTLEEKKRREFEDDFVLSEDYFLGQTTRPLSSITYSQWRQQNTLQGNG